MIDYEKLGLFYLGRRFDLTAGRALASEPILYDSKDLTTHGVIVGMTGSGKTGLAVTLLEEAAIDGIPIVAIDPKGDLGNLLLTFPELDAASFRPWVDEAEAARRGRTPDEEAAATAERWKQGLADWDQPAERIARFSAASERVIYTPGSRAGRPLGLLRSMAAPPPTLVADEDAMREREQACAAGLLGLLGIDADPLRSREQILLSLLLDRAWREGRGMDLAGLIQQIQKPPIERVGVLDLESFFPAKERRALALSVNNLAASPAFAAWAEGDPLDASALLYAADGRPRLSILSIAHLSDAERMFVVTLVLSELIAWMRTQPGTPSLRALLYMDEVFGFFPPTANPPAKTPMLTLLKQARAHGLGVVLATQNPVDLDYKGLGNAGTWWLGRLSTERDKARVIEGIETVAGGAGLDRSALDATLSSLPGRVFLMRNVHEDAPVLMHSRWALSYLAGPLTRDQIRRLEGASPVAARPAQAAFAATPTPGAADTARPAVPAGVAERFVPVTQTPSDSETLVYRPSLLGVASLHYVQTRAAIDCWEKTVWLAPLDAHGAATPWDGASEIGRAAPELDAEPVAGARFAQLPAAAARADGFEHWRQALATHLYRSRPLVLWQSTDPEAVSRPGEGEGAFRARLRDAARALRDAQVERLRAKYASQLATLRDRRARAEQRLESEREQYGSHKMETAISLGASVVGALFGRKLGTRTNVGRAVSVARSIARAADERGDVGRAAERVEQIDARITALEALLEREIATLGARHDGAADAPLEKLEIAPRKSDLEVEPLLLMWTPWRVAPDGTAQPAFSIA